jgi:hypothetical protein
MTTNCLHSEKERSWNDVYTHSDLKYALQKKYTILRIFELWHYKETAPVFRNFVNVLSRLKIRNSGIPPGFTEAEYCKFVNEKMCFEGQFELKEGDIIYNSQLRQLAKLNNVSFLGKIFQNTLGNQTHFVKDRKKLISLARSDTSDLMDFTLLNHDSIAVTTKKKSENDKTNLKSNCILGSLILSNSRVDIFTHLETILENGCTIYSIDTGMKFVKFEHKLS